MKNGDLVKEARKKHNLTQNELANFLGVTLSCVRSWEQSRYSIHPCAVKLLNFLINNEKIEI